MSVSVDWLAEALRMTAFPVETDTFDPSQAWDKIIGDEPAETQSQRGGYDARHVEHGNGIIALITQSDRIEWRYQFRAEEDEPALPIMGGFAEELSVLRELCNQWLTSPIMVPISRLAFGAKLIHPVNSERQGLSALSGLLSPLDLEDVSDFAYRVNRQRYSSVVEDLRVNRLSNWQVINVKLVRVNIGSVVSQQSSVITDHACRLDLDINTSPDYLEALPHDKLVALFDELIALGRELSDKGDIR